MNAIPPAIHHPWRMSAAATKHRAKPVKEMALASAATRSAGYGTPSDSRGTRSAAAGRTFYGRGGHWPGSLAGPRRGRKGLYLGADAHAAGRMRANSVWAASAETPATGGTRDGVEHPMVGGDDHDQRHDGGYTARRALSPAPPAIRIIGTASISANATCIEGTAA